MDGPSCYREAVQLLAAVRRGYETGPTMSHEHEAASLAEAQVYATLALAAAVAGEQATKYDGDEYRDRTRGWAGVV